MSKKKPELLAPAGNYEKAQIALLYGADAVYVGGQKFSLRYRASNFTIEEITKLVDYAHSLKKKVYVTMNIIPRNEDFESLDQYLTDLAGAKVDAIIVSSPYIINRCHQIAPQIETHLSTQMSVTNSLALEYYQSQQITRAVLGREVTLEEIRQIRQNSTIELEVFIHGGMCTNYSGRCLLSNYLTNRDANRGGCAHSCRWNYTLFHGQRFDQPTFNFGSKDLMALDYIGDLIDIGIDSLKIEGRMKSIYYLATVIRTYRMAIDQYLNQGFIDHLELKKEIQKAENRKTSWGFYQGPVLPEGLLYDLSSEEPTKEFLGIVLGFDPNLQEIMLEQRNYFKIGDFVEFFGPDLTNTSCQILKITDYLTQEPLEVARHPLQKLIIKTDLNQTITLKPHDLMRKKATD